MIQFLSSALISCLLVVGASTSFAAGTNSIPSFEDLYKALRTHLKGVSAEELDQAAARGLLNELQSRVFLLTNSAAAETNLVLQIPTLSRSEIYESSFGYFRIGRVAEGLAEDFRKGYADVSGTNRLKGLVVDLRFATGSDYAAAAAAADLFMESEQPLLRWGETSVRSTAKAQAIKLPVVVLVNQQTTGAAEALAGILRDLRAGLLIGSATAGQASLFKEITLDGGQRLRVASSPIVVGNTRALPADGLKPDIAVQLPLEDEKAYFEDAYRSLPRMLTQGSASSTNLVGSLSATNRAARRRINEAELVRLQREGGSIDGEGPARFLREDANRSQVMDPALARALDLLKGLAVVQQKRSA